MCQRNSKTFMGQILGFILLSVHSQWLRLVLPFNLGTGLFLKFFVHSDKQKVITWKHNQMTEPKIVCFCEAEYNEYD